ncbi:hypothetical protein [Wielerella bovis]|uniref:hypothetical protein n=1 Tax=Wielerella bovis TaxID=2917790 RepID=UPI002019D800|nr:hypothetical protein [Wielerella bovis]MCG7657646.1 hypothetical protein [Wielerella bovis]MCG7659867.1 hypothetical protein [Wielerella bovis]
MKISKKTAFVAVAVLLAPVLVHAQPTRIEQNQFEVCSMVSYVSYNAMKGYQSGLSQAKNRSALIEKFVASASDVDGKAFLTHVIDTALVEIDTLPKGQSAQQQEDYSKQFAFATLKGCADEFGLDLNKFKN